MEILPFIKTHHSTTSFLFDPCFPVNSKRKPIFITEAKSISWNCFRGVKKGLRSVLHSSYGEGGSILHPDTPLSVDLEPLSGETQFDRVVAEAQQLEESVVVLWMANWCRKCIYLKPKLEKLAADYYPRVRFYSIDVNNVPHNLVVRAGVTLWRDGKKQAEVIGGHKAYLVVNEVREMIENENVML